MVLLNKGFVPLVEFAAALVLLSLDGCGGR
jgi:hypothetical protein